MGPDAAKVMFRHLEGGRSVKFPQVCCTRTLVRLRFYLSTYEDIDVC